MSKRVLFVSIAFPPKADPECIQAARYFYYLSRHDDFKIDVVTSRNPTLFMPVDLSLGRFAEVGGQLIELPICESKYVSFLARKLFPTIIGRPDSKMTFHWQWRKVISSLKVVPDVIYSRSNPLSSSIMALKLAKWYNRPWVMHLSDPWADNALCAYSDGEVSYHAKMERECFERASIISVTSERTGKLYKVKYPEWAHKIKVFPNVYDPNTDLINCSAASYGNVKRIIYTGGLANTRTAEVLLQAFHLTVQRFPELSNRLEVIFAGETDRKNDAIFRKFSLPFVRHLGRLSAEEALMLQASADLLVVIDSEVADPDKAVFFPSKLVDYAMFQKPLLAITGLGSATDDFVKGQGGVSFPHKGVHELSAWLQSYLKGDKVMEIRKIDRYYAADEQASRLIQLLKEFTS